MSDNLPALRIRSSLIEFALRHGLTFSEDGNPQLGGLSPSAMITQLRLAYEAQAGEGEFLPSPQEWAAHLQLYREKLRLSFERMLQEKLSCYQEDLGPALRLLEAVVGPRPSVADRAMFLHMLVNVKRALFRLPVDRSVFVNFKGAKGAGKSQFLRDLFCTFGKELVWWDQTAQAICDERNVPALASTVVTLVSELRGAEKADLAALKALIDARTISYKPLYTNSRETVEKRTQFVSSSNFHLNEILPPDPTGMRKWYEFTTLDVMDWAAITDICRVQGDTLWLGIPEQAGTRFFDQAAKEISETQERMVPIDVTLQFLADTGLVPAGTKKDKGAVWVRHDSLWEAFKIWSENTRLGKMYSTAWLSTQLTNRCPVQSINRIRVKGGARTRVYRLIPTGEFSSAGMIVDLPCPSCGKSDTTCPCPL